MKNKESPTLEDVARAAQVSTATISRAINEPDKVASKTLDRITLIIEELGYTPNFGGRALASNRSNTVGAVIPTMANAMFASGLQLFQETLAKASINMLVASSGYNAQTELEQIKSLIAHGADGLLLIGSTRPIETIRFLELRKIPYVIAWCYQDDPLRYFAGFDNAQAAQAITNEVLTAGHRHIAMIAGHANQNDRSQNRIKGVKQAVKEYGEGAELLTIQETDYTLNSGGDAFELIMQADKKPTAIVCGNDVLAAGAIIRAKQRGVEIPRDLSVTGFDDIALAKVVSPALTTVQVPQLAMGKAAAVLLLKLLNNEQASSTKLPTQIIHRESLAPRHRGSPTR